MTISTTTAYALILGFATIAVFAVAMLYLLRKRRSAMLRRKFGRAEYARAVNEGGNRRHAEARLEARSNSLRAGNFRR